MIPRPEKDFDRLGVMRVPCHLCGSPCIVVDEKGRPTCAMCLMDRMVLSGHPLDAQQLEIRDRLIAKRKER